MWILRTPVSYVRHMAEKVQVEDDGVPLNELGRLRLQCLGAVVDPPTTASAGEVARGRDGSTDENDSIGRFPIAEFHAHGVPVREHHEVSACHLICQDAADI